MPTPLSKMKSKLPVFVQNDTYLDYIIMVMLLVSLWNTWPYIIEVYSYGTCRWTYMSPEPLVRKLAMSIVWLIYGFLIRSVPTIIIHGITTVATLVAIIIIIYRNSYSSFYPNHDVLPPILS